MIPPDTRVLAGFEDGVTFLGVAHVSGDLSRFDMEAVVVAFGEDNACVSRAYARLAAKAWARWRERRGVA